MPTQTKLTDSELWQTLIQAEARRGDQELPLGVRILSAEIFSQCLREAANRGYTYGGLRKKVISEAMLPVQS